MKRLFLSFAVLMGLGSIAAAQTSGSNSSNTTSVSSSRATDSSSNTSNGNGQQAAKRDNRDIYKWKDGQRATPTGHEATGTNGAHATLPKDSATAPRDSTKK